MATTRDVAVLVGSLRKQSFTRKVALALAELSPKTLQFDIVEIRDLNLYDEDLDKESPATRGSPSGTAFGAQTPCSSRPRSTIAPSPGC
jgi:NAD(P)H-dependent FMN reductase